MEAIKGTENDRAGPSGNAGKEETNKDETDDGFRSLCKFFKSELDKTKVSLETACEKKRFSAEHVLNLQMVGALFGAGTEVVDLIMDYLAMLRVVNPALRPKLTETLREMENVKQMGSRFSLKSLKIWLKPILTSDYQLLLENAICEVNFYT